MTNTNNTDTSAKATAPTANTLSPTQPELTRNSSQNDPLHTDPGFELFSKDKWFDDFCELMTAKESWKAAKKYYQENPQLLLQSMPVAGSPVSAAVPKELELSLVAFGRPVDDETLAVLQQMWPMILDEKAKAANLEVEQLWSTLLRIADYLGIDAQASRKAPGKPSDVFIDAIEKYARNAPVREAQLALKLEEAAQMGKDAAKQFRQTGAKSVRPDSSADEDANWLNRTFGFFGKSKP